MSAPLLWVRATVNLPGLRVGERAFVVPDDPNIAPLLAESLIVPDGNPDPGAPEAVGAAETDAVGDTPEDAPQDASDPESASAEVLEPAEALEPTEG